MRAVIIAGGKGVRVERLGLETPKALFPVAGTPVLQRQIEVLRRNGVCDLTLVVGHRADAIRRLLGDGRQRQVRISYFEETRPLGTGGALAELKDQLSEPFIVLYGDLVLDMDMARLIRFHAEHRALCTLTVHPNDHPDDSDVIVMDRSCLVRGILPKNKPRASCYSNLVNAGVFICDPGLLDWARPAGPQDLERDIVRPAIASERVYGYRTTEYIRDMGTAERYARVQADAKTGVAARRNLRREQRAVFLNCPDRLAFDEGAIPALRALNASEYICLVITSQSAAAPEPHNAETLDEMRRCLETRIAEGGAYIEGLYYRSRPAGRGGECREAEISLVEEAAIAFNIDLSASYFISNSSVDTQIGMRSGMRTVLLSAGASDSEARYGVGADLRADSLIEAVGLIFAEVRTQAKK